MTVQAKSKIRAFIFDMDGTMINSMPYHQLSWVTFASRHGVQMDVAELMRRTTGRTGTECMGELFARVMTPAEALPFVHEKEAIYRELFAPKFEEVAGFKAFLALAGEANVLCAVGTAGDAENVAFAFSNLFSSQEAAHIPNVVVRGDMGLAGKPDPAIFLEAARQLGCQPSECVVFEDAPFGIEAARRAGMHAVAITSTHTAEELAGDHVLTNTADYGTLSLESLLNF
jgi:beta-phosphoglucomutase-like phosphatase (HAD superfamily)